jgi:hypothetical protein
MNASNFSIPLFLLALLLTACDSQVTAVEQSSITGSVYCDQNQDGNCDCEEGGLENISVQIFVDHCGGTALQTITTDEKGNFTFQDIDPSTYFIRADLNYVCGGRVPTTTTCQQVEAAAGKTVSLPPFGFSEYGQ